MAAEQHPPWGPDPWDPVECKRYIVEEIGNKEQFPARHPYQPGATIVLERLIELYGENFFNSSKRVLRNWLEDLEGGSPEERALWYDWRKAQADRVESKWWISEHASQVVACWNDGGKSFQYISLIHLGKSAKHVSATCYFVLEK
ncbi:MAG: hypothetical protein Q9208_000076 [Pyrenodesmia sp. 3 TL-2023]